MSKKKQELGLSFKASEMELIAAAARLAGSDGVSAWARKTLVEAARVETQGQQGLTATSGEKKKPVSRPKCTCGSTNNPNGECDGSCIMRF